MTQNPFELLCDVELPSDCLQQVVRGGHGHSGTAHGACRIECLGALWGIKTCS